MQKKFSVATRIASACLTALLFLSCTPFIPPDRSTVHKDIPQSFSLGSSIASHGRWWQEFSNSQLTSLIETALTENLTLRAHWARLEKIQAQAGKTTSSLYPSVSGNADASYTRRNTESDGSSESQNYSLGLFASYEFDLWGRVRAEVKSAELTAAASREDLNAAAMTIAAEVAHRWLGIAARYQEKELLLKQLKINQTYLELVELRFRKSLASAIDVMQQRQLVERVQAQIPLVEMQELLLQNELAVLTGQMPQNFEGIANQPLPVLKSPPASGLPVQLLENRPDIRAAVNRLQAADQDLVVARADRLPALRITGSGGYNSSDIDQIFDNWLLNLAASLTGPLLDGGRRKAEVEASEAEVREQLFLYHQVVLNGVKEVEEALIREEKIREHVQRAEKQLKVSQITLAEARSRYMNGLSDYLPVLTQLLSVQSLQMDLISRNEDLLGARISLYRSIGGTWADELTVPDSISPKQQDGKL